MGRSTEVDRHCRVPRCPVPVSIKSLELFTNILESMCQLLGIILDLFVSEDGTGPKFLAK